MTTILRNTIIVIISAIFSFYAMQDHTTARAHAHDIACTAGNNDFENCTLDK